MAFLNLTQKLQDVLKQLRSKGALTEKDVQSAMREVRLALLEADVSFKVVKEFVAGVTEKAVGSDVLSGLNPGAQVVKIVNDELVGLLGTTQSKLTFAPRGTSVFMMVGLQGAGKTTTCAKLAAQLRKMGKKPMLAACDTYRPAAAKQLEVLAKGLGLHVVMPQDAPEPMPLSIARVAMDRAEKDGNDVLIIDTAGRLHIDEELMAELVEMRRIAKPQEILLVVDAMTGQDAVNVAESFSSQLGIDGVILTKLDGDARGGAALSVRAATGKPIKYVGMGEKIEELEAFHPDRMAGRILGMGDVMSLVEKAQQALDESSAQELERKVRQNTFTLADFLEQMRQVRKMGSLKDIIGMIPGAGGLGDIDVDEKALGRVEAMILSMTPKERDNPSIINGARKRRIAAGSGQSIQDVNRLLKQFEEMKKMMKQFGDMGKGLGGLGGKRGKFTLPFMR